MSHIFSLSFPEALCAFGASFVTSAVLLSKWLSPAMKFWEESAVRGEDGRHDPEIQFRGSAAALAHSRTEASGDIGSRAGARTERNPFVLVLVCALLGLAQLAMHALAHVADIPTGIDAIRVPLSCVLFPLNLAALLYLYLTRNSTSFGWVLGYVVGVNLFVAGLTCVLRRGWFDFSAFLPAEWAPKLWSVPAMYTILCGTSTTVIVTVIMVFVCNGLQKSRVRVYWRGLLVIALPLVVALVIDSLLYSLIVYCYLAEPFSATLLGHLLCQLLVGVAYAGCVWLALQPKAPQVTGAGAPAPSALRFFWAALRQVARRLKLWVLRAARFGVRLVRELFSLTNVAFVAMRKNLFAPACALLDSARRPKHVPLKPDPDDLPPTGPFAALHRAALERFAVEREELARGELRGKWVVYVGAERREGVADESRSRLFRRCLDELSLARGQFTLCLVEPALAETAPSAGDGLGAAVAERDPPPTGPFAALHRAALERFAVEREELARGELRGKWVVYVGAERREGVADESRSRLFRRCLDELSLARGQFTLCLVEPALAETAP